ncbi:MAG: InlB B-repeat-containing protein, partial [Defluviitaleaceae bacterium]|nr:InlB B-repeat-containing protein [Defluviitaleaceae bacterium]
MKKRTRDSIMRAISFMLIMIFVIGDVSSIAAATQTDMNITLNPTAINSPGLMHIEENDFNVVDTPVFYMDYDAFASVSEPLNFGEAISASGSIFDTIELTHDPVSPILDPEPASFGIQGLSSELELEFDARIPNFHTFYNIFDTFETTTPSALNVSMDSTIGVMPRSNVVTIVYRGNGHTGGTVPASHSISTPGSIVLRSPGNMIRAGHIFFGWRDSGGNIFPAGQTLTWTSAVAGTLTLDAYWIPSTVTIHYRGNGHTGGTVPASQTITTPGSISLRLQGNMVRAGHTFLGWHDGGGNIFWPGETITFPNPVSGSIILDAHWGLSTVTINYRGNGHTGGTVPASQSVHTPGSVNLRTQGNLVRTGYVFAGWRDSVGTIFAPGQLISWNTPMTGTLTLDAHWIPSTVTIQYRGNGHTSGTIPANQTVNTPGSVSLRAQGNMARSGHIFVGWRDSAGDVFPPGQVFNFAAGVHGTMTLDAHWIPSIVTINYRSNGHTSGTVPASQNVTTPGSVNVRAQGNLARTGYVFSGWMDAGGNVFAPGQTVDFDTAVSGTVTLNAVWEAQCTETWYTFTVRDGNRDVEVYVLADMSRAVTRQAGSSIGTELRLIGNSWVPRGNLSFAPGGIAPADGSIAPRMAPPMFIPMMTINIDQAKNAAIAVIRGEFLDTFGFTPNMLTAED